MTFGIDDPNPQGFALVDYAGGKFYNWSARQVEAAPFDYTKHMLRATQSPIKLAAPAAAAGGTAPPAPPAGLHLNSQFVDVGGVAEAYPQLTPTWYTLDASGVPQRVNQTESNPAQLRAAARGIYAA